MSDQTMVLFVKLCKAKQHKREQQKIISLGSQNTNDFLSPKSTPKVFGGRSSHPATTTAKSKSPWPIIGNHTKGANSLPARSSLAKLIARFSQPKTSSQDGYVLMEDKDNTNNNDNKKNIISQQLEPSRHSQLSTTLSVSTILSQLSYDTSFSFRFSFSCDLQLKSRKFHIGTICNPLVVILCIGKYNNMTSLIDSSKLNYKNMIHTFHDIFGYCIFYQTETETTTGNKGYNLIFGNNNGHKNQSNVNINYKTEWLSQKPCAIIESNTSNNNSKNNEHKCNGFHSEIDEFCDAVREQIKQQKLEEIYDGLIFIVSCYGDDNSNHDENDTILDSHGEKIALSSIISQFSNRNCPSLATKAKVFLIDRYHDPIAKLSSVNGIDTIDLNSSLNVNIGSPPQRPSGPAENVDNGGNMGGDMTGSGRDLLEPMSSQHSNSFLSTSTAGTGGTGGTGTGSGRTLTPHREANMFKLTVDSTRVAGSGGVASGVLIRAVKDIFTIGNMYQTLNNILFKINDKAKMDSQYTDSNMQKAQLGHRVKFGKYGTTITTATTATAALTGLGSGPASVGSHKQSRGLSKTSQKTRAISVHSQSVSTLGPLPGIVETKMIAIPATPSVNAQGFDNNNGYDYNDENGNGNGNNKHSYNSKKRDSTTSVSTSTLVWNIFCCCCSKNTTATKTTMSNNHTNNMNNMNNTNNMENNSNEHNLHNDNENANGNLNNSEMIHVQTPTKSATEMQYMSDSQMGYNNSYRDLSSYGPPQLDQLTETGRSGIRPWEPEASSTTGNSFPPSMQLQLTRIGSGHSGISGRSGNSSMHDQSVSHVQSQLQLQLRSPTSTTISTALSRRSRIINEDEMNMSMLFSGDIRLWDKPFGKGASGRVFKGVYLPLCQIIAVKVVNGLDKINVKQILGEFHDQQELLPDCDELMRIFGWYRDLEKNTVAIALEYMDMGSVYDSCFPKHGNGKGKGKNDRDLKEEDERDEDLLNTTAEEQEASGHKQIVVDKLTIEQIAYITRGCLIGLDSLHSCDPGLVHRDIKPQNILLSSFGQVKIADFGLLKRVNKETNRLYDSKGTEKYFSPERINKNYGPKCDIWAFGITLIEIFNQKLIPMEQLDWFKLVDQGVDVKDFLDDNIAPGEFVDFVSKCLAQDENTRPNAKELLNHEFVSGVGMPKWGDEMNVNDANITFANMEKDEKGLKKLLQWLEDWILQDENQNARVFTESDAEYLKFCVNNIARYTGNTIEYIETYIAQMYKENINM